MKNIYLIIALLFIFVGCGMKQAKTPQIKTGKSFYYIDEFIYKKDQIVFFENEFQNILKLNNKETLQRYADFYRKNTSYFVNGLQKAEILEKKIEQPQIINMENRHRELITKALSLNRKNSEKIYLELAKENNIFAQRELAQMYKISDEIKSIYWYKKLIENNDIKSIKDYAYANIYMIRPIIVQDVKKAVKLYEKLEALGENSSLMLLGNIYEYGYFKNDFPQDKKKALEYYKKASNKNYTNAQRKLAKIYLCQECDGNRYDKEKGIKLLNILVSKKDKESIEMLNKINEQSIKTEEIQPIQEENQEGMIKLK